MDKLIMVLLVVGVLAVVAVVVASIVDAQNRESFVKSCIGLTAGQLIDKLGPPDGTLELDANTRVFLYARTKENVSMTPSTGFVGGQVATVNTLSVSSHQVQDKWQIVNGIVTSFTEG